MHWRLGFLTLRQIVLYKLMSYQLFKLNRRDYQGFESQASFVRFNVSDVMRNNRTF
jgi:hypothetical protein